MQTYAKKHCTLKKTIMFIKKPWYSWWLRNPAITSWYGKYPIIYRVSYMLGGCLGFLPSTPDTFRLVPWGPDTKSLGDARHLFNVKWIPFTRPRRLGEVYPRYPMQEAMEWVSRHLSYEKKPFYFPLNPGWLIGILIMAYEIIPIYLGSIIPIYRKQPGFFSLLIWKGCLTTRSLGEIWSPWLPTTYDLVAGMILQAGLCVNLTRTAGIVGRFRKSWIDINDCIWYISRTHLCIYIYICIAVIICHMDSQI